MLTMADTGSYMPGVSTTMIAICHQQQTTYTLCIPRPHDAIPGTFDCTERCLLVLRREQLRCQLVSFAAIERLKYDKNTSHNSLSTFRQHLKTYLFRNNFD